MQVDVPLGQPARFVLAGLASVLSLVLAYLAFTSFIVSSLTRPAISLRRSEIDSAARYYPRSAGIQALVGYAELAADRDPEAAANRAEAAGIRAAQLSPKRFEYRLLVASAREMKGDRAGAEQSLREGLALAPNRVETFWRLANSLLRQGKLDESLSYFNRAISARHMLIPQTLALIWGVSGGNVSKMEAAVGNSAKGQRDLAFFLIQRGLITEGVQVFNHIDRAERLSSDESGAFITALTTTGHLELARKIWGDMVTTQPEQLKTIIFNGGFEHEIRGSLNQFDWMLSENNYVRSSIAAGTAHSGARALRLDFKGIDTTRIDGEIRQQLLVRPGARYRLTFFVKTNGLQTPEGPRVVLTNPDRVTQIAASEPIAAGSADWKQMEVVFTAPPSLATILVQVKRIPKFSYDDPTKGTIWLDDIELVEATK